MANQRSPEALFTELVDLLESSVTEFQQSLPAIERELFAEIQRELSFLGIKDGRLERNPANLNRLQRVRNTIERILLGPNSPYVAGIDKLKAAADRAINLQRAYFNALGENWRENTAFAKVIRESSLAQLNETLLGSGIQQQYILPTLNVVQNNIATGATYAQMVSQLRALLTDNGVTKGLLDRYASLQASDGVMQYNRLYLEAVTADLGLEWYFYAGTTIRTTRDFCKARAGKFFHRREILTWPDSNWSGKVPGTNASTIYTYVGGYNCRHILRPVSRRLVPRADVERAERLGYIQTDG